jgi:cytochrome c5/ABC-type uncharacterized transport system substrate-binding protein
MSPGSRSRVLPRGRGRISSIAGLLAVLVPLAFAAAPARGQQPGYRGVDIFDAACSVCHTNGEEGAPRVGDRAAWEKRIAQGLDVLTRNTLEGVRNMPPHAGNTSLSRLELRRAIVYMVNASGGDWVEPADPRPQGARRSGAQIARAHCALCHESGFGGAPRIGDRAAWLPHTKLGLDPMVRTAARGHGTMPPRGGKADLSDAELRDAVIYMISAPGGRAAKARGAEKKYRVATILTTSPLAEMAGPNPVHPMIGGFVHALRALGYVEGDNLILERRSAGGKPERYPGIIAELVRLKTDVIVTAGGAGLLASAKKEWGAVPVVMFGSSNPVPYGLAKSLAHPGGNLTGLLAITGPEIEAKRLQLLKEAIPRLSRVVYLSTKAVWEGPFTKAVREAAAALGIELLHVEHEPGDLAATFGAIERLHPDALFVSLGTESFGQRRQIVAFARKARLPGSYPFAPMVEDGGLMSYGVSISDLGRRAAHYVDKILKGARPGDLPIERPTRFELAINLKAAKEFGLTIPRSVLVQADWVIE